MTLLLDWAVTSKLVKVLIPSAIHFEELTKLGIKLIVQAVTEIPPPMVTVPTWLLPLILGLVPQLERVGVPHSRLSSPLMVVVAKVVVALKVFSPDQIFVPESEIPPIQVTPSVVKHDAVLVALDRISPTTSKALLGVVVPIPTLPDAVIRNRSAVVDVPIGVVLKAR